MHQCPVNGLLGWVQAEEPHGGSNRRLDRPGSRLLGQDPRERVERELAQPLPLGQEPLLQRVPLCGEAFEEIPR